MAPEPSGVGAGESRAQRTVAGRSRHDACVQTKYRADAAARIAELARGRRLAICYPIAFERMYSTRSPDLVRAELAAQTAGTIAHLSLTTAAEQRALEVQARLSDRGYFRAYRMPDLLIAAVAEAAGALLMHYDHDFDLIAGITRQPAEWIIPRGAGHRNER